MPTASQNEQEKKAKNYKTLSIFQHHKAKEKAGGSFFTVTHHKSPTEYGIWGRSKRELENYFNKIRRHFVSIIEET